MRKLYQRLRRSVKGWAALATILILAAASRIRRGRPPK